MKNDKDPIGGTYRFAAQQSSIGKILLSEFSGKTAEDLNSIILITAEGDLFCRSDAVLNIGKEARLGAKRPVKIYVLI